MAAIWFNFVLLRLNCYNIPIVTNIHYNIYFVTWGKILTCLATETKKRQKSVAAILKNGRHFVLIGIVMPELV